MMKDSMTYFMGQDNPLDWLRQVAVYGDVLFSLLSQKKPLHDLSVLPSGITWTMIPMASASFQGSGSSYFRIMRDTFRQIISIDM